MGKAAATSKTTTSAQGDLEQLIDSSAKSMARTQVFASLLGMGWRLAVAVLVPLLLGVRLDNRLNSEPAYTLSGFMLAIGLSSYMIYREYQHIQSDQKRNTKHTKGRA